MKRDVHIPVQEYIARNGRPLGAGSVEWEGGGGGREYDDVNEC